MTLKRAMLGWMLLAGLSPLGCAGHGRRPARPEPGGPEPAPAKSAAAADDEKHAQLVRDLEAYSD